MDLLDARIDSDTRLQATWCEGLLGGVMVVEAQGAVGDMSTWEGQLYRPVAVKNLAQREVSLVAVPYYAWANRGPGAMRVWIPRTEG